MDDLYKLFHLCAYDVDYEQVGDSVNYAFQEGVNDLYIFFQGSNSITDWVENFLFSKKVYGEFRVHRGFLMAYNQVRSIVLDKIYSKTYDKVIVVGYSHGGALATLCHEDIKYHFPKIELHTYAFESPRCVKAKKDIRKRWNDLCVIRTNQDIVCHCPPKIFGYDDLGTMLKVKGDTSLVKNRLPKCIKSHYPQVVLNALEKLREKN